jgi:hypothetical protein
MHKLRRGLTEFMHYEIVYCTMIEDLEQCNICSIMLRVEACHDIPSGYAVSQVVD